MDRIVLVVICIVLGLTAILKVLHIYYLNQSKQLENLEAGVKTQISLMNSDISYDKYKRISTNASVQNSPVRACGDFSDFFISHIITDSQMTENKIMSIDNEECYE